MNIPNVGILLWSYIFLMVSIKCCLNKDVSMKILRKGKAGNSNRMSRSSAGDVMGGEKNAIVANRRRSRSSAGDVVGGEKKAIVPKRRTTNRYQMEKELAEHYRNDYHRPNFPEKEVVPNINLKYPKFPDPLVLPAKPSPPPPRPIIQVKPVYVVEPPHPPPPPLVIQTGSGPAATVTQPIPVSPTSYKTKELLDKLGINLPNGNDLQSGSTDVSAAGATSGGGVGGDGGALAAPSIGGAGGGSYQGSGPARGGEDGIAGTSFGSGDGDVAGKGGGMSMSGADWTGTGIPSGGSDGYGKLSSGSALSGLLNGGGGPSGAYGASAAGVGNMVSVLMDFCCKSHKDDEHEHRNVTALCQLYKQYHKNLKCIENIVKASADYTAAGMAEIKIGHSKPIQIARGFLGAELFRLEDIIGNLNKKIDIIGDRVTKRPNQLARASLMAGMTSTFGDLQNTIELLNQKLDERLNPRQEQYLQSMPEEEREKTKAINILSKQLEQLGGAGWLGSKGFGLSLHRHEEEMKEARQRGLEEAQVMSNNRLEELMHTVADRLAGLSDLMDHPPSYHDSGGIAADPILRQEEEELMGKQLQIEHQMAIIQAGLRGLANLVVNLQNARVQAATQQSKMFVPQKFIELVQKVLGNAANAFRGIALTTKGAGNYLVNSLNQHVHHAGHFGDHLLSAGHTIDTKLNSLRNGENVQEIMDSLAATYTTKVANGGVYPYGGKLFGIHGANDGIHTAGLFPYKGRYLGVDGDKEDILSQNIPHLAASIALMRAPGEDSLNRKPLVEDFPSTEGIAHFLDTNPFSYGFYGNRLRGKPFMGVVTGNLGGSLGMGGIDGIDGGNALILNKTTKIKRTIKKLFQPALVKTIQTKSPINNGLSLHNGDSTNTIDPSLKDDDIRTHNPPTIDKKSYRQNASKSRRRKIFPKENRTIVKKRNYRRTSNINKKNT